MAPHNPVIALSTPGDLGSAQVQSRQFDPAEAVSVADFLASPGAGRGVRIEGDDDIEPLKAHLGNVPFFALNLPKFADGRSYSHARRLRALWGYEGAIVAFGDVLRDQAHHLARCGVDRLHLRDDQDPRACLEAFRRFSEYYQYQEGAVG